MKGFDTKRTGNLGENIACRFLEDKGFTVIKCNYSVPFGEIDIITKKRSVWHFVEVKTVSCEYDPLELDHRPEEKVDYYKYRKIAKVAELYLHKYVYPKANREFLKWQIDVVAITLVRDTKEARVKFFKNVIFDRRR